MLSPTVIRSPLSASLNTAYFGEIVVPRRMLDFKSVAYPYRKSPAVFKYTAVVFKIGNIIGIYDNALVYGDKTRVRSINCGMVLRLRSCVPSASVISR